MSLIGKTISYYDSENGAVKTGVVKGVSFANGWPALAIDGKMSICPVSSELATPRSAARTRHRPRPWPIRCRANGSSIRDPSDPNTAIEGYVKSIDTSGSVPRLNVGATLVDLSSVVSVSKSK